MNRISDPHFAERVRASFAKQQAMDLIRATLPVVEHGRTEEMFVTPVHQETADYIEGRYG